MTKLIYKQLTLPALLIGALYIAGTFGKICESYHHSVLMSCAIFLIVFGSIVALGIKIYNSYFH